MAVLWYSDFIGLTQDYRNLRSLVGYNTQRLPKTFDTDLVRPIQERVGGEIAL